MYLRIPEPEPRFAFCALREFGLLLHRRAGVRTGTVSMTWKSCIFCGVRFFVSFGFAVMIRDRVAARTARLTTVRGEGTKLIDGNRVRALRVRETLFRAGVIAVFRGLALRLRFAIEIVRCNLICG